MPLRMEARAKSILKGGARGNAQPKRPLKSSSKRSNIAARLHPDGNDPMDLLEVLVHKDSFVSTPTL